MPDYQLIRDGQALATLTRTGSDFPWHEGAYVATDAFEAVRPLFDRERALLEQDRMDEWERAWEEIEALGLVLRPLDGRPDIVEFLIHFDDAGAWWRY